MRMKHAFISSVESRLYNGRYSSFYKEKNNISEISILKKVLKIVMIYDNIYLESGVKRCQKSK